MEEKDLNIRAKVIKKIFDDNRKIVESVDIEDLEIDRDIHQGGDIFITSAGDFIDLEFQTVDFTAEELAKYMELAEALYEKYEKEISIYVICPKNINISVREFELHSDAPFTIKLACISEDPCEILLNCIKQKMAEQSLDDDDLNILANLHKMCGKENSHYYLTEYIKIANMMHY